MILQLEWRQTVNQFGSDLRQFPDSDMSARNPEIARRYMFVSDNSYGNDRTGEFFRHPEKSAVELIHLLIAGSGPLWENDQGISLFDQVGAVFFDLFIIHCCNIHIFA